ncbi:MAG: OadG family protein [candidate division Zixibacteria bacterium]|nr:OadG family protein [candidate division Zixibacteria bacterium]
METSFRFGLEFAAIGIVIVFAALTLISVVISLVRRADSGWQKKETVQLEEALTREQNIDTTTLVLICAAAATMIQGRFYIRQVRRLLPRDAQRGPWSAQGRAILHGSHVVPKKR